MSLKLRKLDLHLHTPASHDFLDKKITAEQIVDHAKSVGLDAIAVTDHNTVDFVDLIKEAAKKKGFTVFPGVEISCGGSVNGAIHVIALFDPAKTKDDLQKVLGLLGIKGSGENALTSKSVSDVIDTIKDAGGLAVLAHANSTHGALADIKGNPRTEVVKNKNLSAVEATAKDFTKDPGKRLIDILNGNDPVYKRKLAVYKSSDNPDPGGTGHSISSIGSQFTYFKMGELTIESLRQCFEDPDTRIIQDYESDKLQSDHPQIESLKISGGFLDSQSIQFHSGMNSIIGGTGTGKSLVVEFLRFVFDKKPDGVLFSDHKEKLNKQLRINGEIAVTFKDSSGDRYEVGRKYVAGKDPYASPLLCKNLSTGKEFKGDISSIFPILIYSQNEILEITRDPQAQLLLLDNFRDFRSFQNEVLDISQNLEKLDMQLVQTIQDSVNLGDLKKQHANTDEQLKKLEKKLHIKDGKSASAGYMKLSQEKSEFEARIEEFDSLKDTVDGFIEELENNMPEKDPSIKGTGKLLETGIQEAYKTVIEALKKADSATDELKKKSVASILKWEKDNKYKDIEKKYNLEIKTKKETQLQEAKRRELLKEKETLSTKISNAEKAGKRYKKIREERGSLLDRLTELRKSYFDERTAQAKLITDRSLGKLKIIVEAGNNKQQYVQQLNKLKVGSLADKKEIELITSTISPVELINIVLDKDHKTFAKLCKITELKAQNIINELSSKSNLQEALSLQYKGFPEDKIEILYKKKDDNYYPLSELSMGQKADALIMIALGDSQMPVIIDQPEDAMDIPSIWDDVCSRLRISKHNRQFAFTTHNSSISVSSDSDQFIILQADGATGWVSKSGSIDSKTIKDEVVGHLEGGYGSYELKRKKYGL